MGRPSSEQRLAHVTQRARWAAAEVRAIAERGYASRGEFQYVRYLLDRGYKLGIPGLPPRDETLARLAALEPRCTARWENVKAERRRERKRRHNAKGAKMTDVLKDAEERMPGYAATRQAEQDQAVAEVREAIGRASYEQAKQQLPIIEKAAGEFRRWCDRIVTMANKAGDYPQPIRQAVENIAKSCEAGPKQLRNGIGMYEGLRFEHIAWMDGRQVDINKRAWYVAETRRNLRTFDGLLSYMRSQRGQAETYIQQAEWPRRSGEPRATATAVREPEHRADTAVPVETAFELGGRILGARPQ